MYSPYPYYQCGASRFFHTRKRFLPLQRFSKVMKYSLYKADAEEENEDSPKLDEKPGGGSTNEYTAT